VKVICIDIGEKIIIGDNVSILNMGAWNSTIRLGMKAPEDVSIIRKELFDKVKEKEVVIIYKKRKKLIRE
jgi:carbon storage regulator